MRCTLAIFRAAEWLMQARLSLLRVALYLSFSGSLGIDDSMLDRLMHLVKVAASTSRLAAHADDCACGYVCLAWFSLLPIIFAFIGTVMQEHVLGRGCYWTDRTCIYVRDADNTALLAMICECMCALLRGYIQ